MGGLARDGFEPALLALVAPWLAPGRVTDVLACGMVGSRQGWVEAALRHGPLPAAAGAFARPAVADPRLAVHVLPGLRQDAPADVMRGEETQIAGLLAARARLRRRRLPARHPHQMGACQRRRGGQLRLAS